MTTEKEYFAFISYQHKDEEWAKKLLSKLEHYRLPSKVRKENSSLPKEIRPIFRDTQELSSGVLKREIEKALQDSKFLIVICSPNAAKSQWVNEEIKYFISLGREERIIPFIVNGIPYSKDEDTECFPNALRSLKGNGELLAINIGEINRDAAYIKVVARMFGLKFDTLWQRYERERRLKRLVWIGAAVIFALIGIGVGAYFVRQNKVIESQNVQLLNLVRNLEEENNTYSQLQSDQKQYTFVGQLRGNGCDDFTLMTFDYHPYEPIVAFTDDWGIWLHYLNSNVEVNLPNYYKGEQIMDISELRFSSDGTKLMAEGHTTSNWDYSYYVWDVQTYKLIGIFSTIDDYPERKYDNPHLSKKINYECKDGRLFIYDITRYRDLCSTDFDSEDSKPHCIYNPVYDEILYISESRAALYDNNKEDFVLFFKGYDNDSNDFNFEFSNSGEYLRIGKNIYERTLKIDTIQNLNYSVHPIEAYPNKSKDIVQYDSISHASLDINENSIIYKQAGHMKAIKVVKEYTSGNIQEGLVDAIFAGPNKVIAIVEQGRFRIYSTKSWNLLGTLPNYIWTGISGGSVDGGGVGFESELGHASSFIALAKYVNNKLYIVSSGCVVRIYDVNKYRLETVIELPVEQNGVDFSELTIDRCDISDDGSKIMYSFEEQSIYYECELPQIKSNTGTE